jgi:hypothetical protein
MDTNAAATVRRPAAGSSSGPDAAGTFGAYVRRPADAAERFEAAG